jgi:hypothetical protein
MQCNAKTIQGLLRHANFKVTMDGVHAVLPCDAGYRGARCKGRLDNMTLFFRRTEDALRRFWLAHTLDDFAHSVIVGPGAVHVQTIVR